MTYRRCALRPTLVMGFVSPGLQTAPSGHPGVRRPPASNGPTEAINRRLEAMRRNALGFQKPHALSPAFSTEQRRTPHTRQSTLNYEEPRN